MKRNINILGSCVTRDAFSRSQKDFNINKYVARHSLHSLFSEPLIEKDKLKKVFSVNSWTEEMLFEDLSKSYLSVFDTQFLVIDLIDERHNYFEIGDKIITETLQLNKSSFLTDYPEKKLIKRGTKKDFDKWIASCEALKKYAEEKNVKIILHETYFADQFQNEKGELVPFENQKFIENQNKRLEYYHSKFKEVVSPEEVIKIDSKFLISAKRKNVFEPFHYVDSYYKSFYKQLKKIYDAHFPDETIQEESNDDVFMNGIQDYTEKPLVSIIMTTYNVEDLVEKAIHSILNQTYKKLELIIVDDNSKDNTIEVIKAINDPRIRVFRNTINSGTYFCKNYGISKSKGDYIGIQDSDDYSSPRRIESQLNYFEEHPEALIVKCQYVRVNPKGKILTEVKAAFQASLIKKTVFDEMGYYDTVRVAADDEFDCRARVFYGRNRIKILPELLYYNLQREDSLTSSIKIGGVERITYVEGFNNWHKENADKLENLVVKYPNINRGFEVHEKIRVKNMNLTKNRFVEEKTVAQIVNASVVSFPKRKNQFKKVVKDILPQVDNLFVYLNDYRKVPDFLNHEKIHVRLGNEYAGDLGDNGKFYEINDLKGYHFTIDDDIKYPKNYFEKLIQKLEKYSYQTVVGVHGIDILYDSFEHYYSPESRKVYSYPHKLDEDTQVHILGTGTVAYHTNLFKIDFSEINKKFMVDIFFAIQVNRALIPMVCIEREKDWMGDYETEEETKIYTTFKRNDDDQSNLVLGHRFKKPILNSLGMNSVGSIIKPNSQKLLDQIDRNQQEIRQLKTSKEELDNKFDKLQEERKWYASTYDHLPLWFLKIGGIFRHIKVNKGFE